MQLRPFLLDMWLDRYEHDIEFNLASSEGPRWTLNEILNLANEEERQRFMNHKLAYSRPAGADGLRAAIADMQDVSIDAVQVVPAPLRHCLFSFGWPRKLEPTLFCLNPAIPPFLPCPNLLESKFATTVSGGEQFPYRSQ